MSDNPQLSLQFTGFSAAGTPTRYLFTPDSKPRFDYGLMPMADRAVLREMCMQLLFEIKEYEDGLGSRQSR